MVSTIPDVKPEPVSANEILAVVTGTATGRAARRVWSQSAQDKSLRSRVAWSLPPADGEDEEIADAVTTPETAPTEMSPALKRRLDTLATRYVRIAASPPVPLATRILTVLETWLTVPAWSPALAASDTTPLAPPPQTIETGDGVRVSFGQLPPVDSLSPSPVRVIVDATALDDTKSYSSAVVSVSEGDTIHRIIVPLNAERRGMTTVSDLPPAHTARRLIGVSLLSGE